MEHTIESTVKYVWHDLTEDPNDLPRDNMFPYILTRNKKTGELDFFRYDNENVAEYLSKEKIWRCVEDDNYGSYDIVTMNSYGMEPTEEPNCDWEVVAWAEDLSPEIPAYTPALYLKGETV